MPIPSKTESIQTLSVKDRIYNVVCEWIITGVLKSGEKILDSELAQYFDVSRTPVKTEAGKGDPKQGKHVNGSVRNSCISAG